MGKKDKCPKCDRSLTFNPSPGILAACPFCGWQMDTAGRVGKGEASQVVEDFMDAFLNPFKGSPFG